MGCLSGITSLLVGSRIDAAQLKRALKHKTPEQKRVIKYFVSTGLLPMLFGMKDAEYDEMVAARRRSIDIKKIALGKIGLDESQVNEIAPVTFEGYEFGGDHDVYMKVGKDGVARSSAYSVTYICFSSTQVYMYQIIFNMDDVGRKEKTEEYFYKDITNLSTITETEQIPRIAGCSSQPKDEIINTKRFAMVVPGDKFSCSTSQDIERQVQAMKAKLREKKE